MSDAPALPASLGHVLVVDGEPLVVNYLKAALQLHGFSVSTAAGGQEALRLLGADPSAIGLALVDLKLPDMSCHDLLTELRRLNPEMRSCVMGAQVDPDDERLRASGAVNVVRKPLGLADLTYALWGMQRPTSGNP